MSDDVFTIRALLVQPADKWPALLQTHQGGPARPATPLQGPLPQAGDQVHVWD